MEAFKTFIENAIKSILTSAVLLGAVILLVYGLTGAYRMTPYEILGVERTADKKAIKKAFQLKAKQTHPDKFPGDADKEAEFIRIKKAYEVLKHPKRRARYDKTGDVEPEEEIDTIAIGIILAHFKTVVLEQEAKVTDYTINVKKKIEEENYKFIEQSMIATIVIKKLRVLKKKFIVTEGEENILIDSLDSDILDLEVSIKILKNQRAVLMRALEILKNYKFTGHNKMPTVPGSSINDLNDAMTHAMGTLFRKDVI